MRRRASDGATSRKKCEVDRGQPALLLKTQWEHDTVNTLIYQKSRARGGGGGARGNDGSGTYVLFQDIAPREPVAFM